MNEQQRNAIEIANDYSPDERDLLYALDVQCPHCHKNCDIGEAFEGTTLDCRMCGARLVVVAIENSDAMYMSLLAPPPLTGRQRTRRLWQKRGRR